jgi:hypothetical protein
MMRSRLLVIGALAVLAATSAASTDSPLRLKGPRPNVAPGSAHHLYVVGTRSALQRRTGSTAKLDPILADLARHAALARPDHQLEDLHSLSPAARFAQHSAGSTPLVLVDATTRGDVKQLQSALIALGLEHAAAFSNDVGGWLPINQLEAATARGEVLSLRAAMPHTRSGAVTTQGDYAQRSDVMRTNYALSGAGVTVGVLSDSFNCYAVYANPANHVPASGQGGYAQNGFTADYATDVSTGDLPSNVHVLEEGDCLSYGAPQELPFSDEGRAMLQIVHDVAPSASLAFRTADNSEADFATGIGAMANAGATVIADDVGYFDEPFFQDGIVAQAIDGVWAQGVAYFSAAGNNSSLAYENTAPQFNTFQNSGNNANEYLLNFDPSGASTVTSMSVTIPGLPPGDFVAIVVQWDQPYVTGAPHSGGTTSSIDVCVTGSGGDEILDFDGLTTSCTGGNTLGIDPYQVMIIANPANAGATTSQENINISIGLANSTPAPGRVIVAVEDDGLGSMINTFPTNSATLQGHPGAAGAAAVGAAFYFTTPRCGTDPAQLEPYSSQGGLPILFDTSGTRLATPIVRQKPDFVGPDGGNDTFLGFTLADAGITGSNGLLSTLIPECQNVPSYPNFFGTSAATPHAASIAALMQQANSTLTPTQIFNALRDSALPMGASTPNFLSGYGFIQADAALPLVPPGAPLLSLGSTTVSIGQPTTISWSSNNAVSCTASGSWNGTLHNTGSETLTPTAPGSKTYTLTCTNTAGTSQAASVTLTAIAPPPAPTLTLSSATISLGSSTTITWSSTGTTSCTASGSWSGTLATSGSKTLTPASAGTTTYSLTCSNGGAKSPSASVTLTTNGIPTVAGGSGGGGNLEWLTLSALLAACLAQLAFPRGRTRARAPARDEAAHRAQSAARTTRP